MPKIKPVASIALLLAAAGIVFLITRGPVSPEAEGNTGTPAPQGPILPTIPKPTPSLTKNSTAPRPRPTLTQAEFDQMVQDWLPLNTGPGKCYVYGLEEDLMAYRCVERLGCGEDLIRLMKAVMLQDSGIDRVFHGAVKRFLAKAGPTERALVAAITSDPKIRQRWCFYAGAGCTPDEVAAFSAQLTDERDRHAVLLGSALYLPRTDPVAALKFVAEQDKLGRAGPFRREVAQEIFTPVQDLSLYPVMEPLLQKADPSARRKLLEQWARADVPGLIRHVNAHADTVTHSDALFLFPRMVSVNGIAETLTAIQDLEDPLLFASAVRVLIPYSCADYTAETMELAQQIANPELRRQAMQAVIDYPEMIKELP